MISCRARILRALRDARGEFVPIDTIVVLASPTTRGARIGENSLQSIISKLRHVDGLSIVCRGRAYRLIEARTR